MWQGSAIAALLDPSIPPPAPVTPKHHPSNETPPRVLRAPEPQSTGFARFAHLNGSVTVYLEVNEQGLPEKIRTLRPLGLGLDETAAYAVSQYKFKPAEQDGKPVRVEMNVVVNYQGF
jgi:protein TonB